MYRRSMIGGTAAAGFVLGAGGVKTGPALVLAQSTILDSRGGPVEAGASRRRDIRSIHTARNGQCLPQA
jgi:hypothetical protein